MASYDYISHLFVIENLAKYPTWWLMLRPLPLLPPSSLPIFSPWDLFFGGCIFRLLFHLGQLNISKVYLPSSKLTWLAENPPYPIGNTFSIDVCSIAISVYARVCAYKLWMLMFPGIWFKPWKFDEWIPWNEGRWKWVFPLKYRYSWYMLGVSPFPEIVANKGLLPIIPGGISYPWSWICLRCLETAKEPFSQMVVWWWWIPWYNLQTTTNTTDPSPLFSLSGKVIF